MPTPTPSERLVQSIGDFGQAVASNKASITNVTDLISQIPSPDKVSVRVVATTNQSLTNLGAIAPTYDGVTLRENDRVLYSGQTNAKENGIYVYANQKLTRATDADSWVKLVSASVRVDEGTVNGDSCWNCTVDAGGTIGVDPIAWTMIYDRTGAIGSALLHIGALPNPVIHTPDSKAPITAISVWSGGVFTITLGAMTITMASSPGLNEYGVVKTYVAPSWQVSGGANSPGDVRFIRAYVDENGICPYVAAGSIYDRVEQQQLQHPYRGTASGPNCGFYSTPVDILLAVVMFGAIGTKPKVYPVINSKTNKVTAKLNGKGSLYLPIDPYTKHARLMVGEAVPSGTNIMACAFDTVGWKGNAYWWGAYVGTTSAVNWADGIPLMLTSANYVGDREFATADAVFDHFNGLSYWKNYQAESCVGDTSGAKGDELLMSQALKQLLDGDYTNGIGLNYANANALFLNWEIIR